MHLKHDLRAGGGEFLRQVAQAHRARRQRDFGLHHDAVLAFADLLRDFVDVDFASSLLPLQPTMTASAPNAAIHTIFGPTHARYGARLRRAMGQAFFLVLDFDFARPRTRPACSKACGRSDLDHVARVIGDCTTLEHRVYRIGTTHLSVEAPANQIDRAQTRYCVGSVGIPRREAERPERVEQ